MNDKAGANYREVSETECWIKRLKKQYGLYNKRPYACI